MRCKKPDRVVTPIVRQAALDQESLRNALVNRQQFHRGDPEPLQVFEDCWVRQSGVGAADLGGDIRMLLGEALDVDLVQHGIGKMPRRSGSPGSQFTCGIRSAVGGRRHHHAPRHRRGGIQITGARGVVDVVAIDRRTERHLAGDRPRVGIQHQLGGVAARSGCRIVGPLDPERILLAGLHPLGKTVPDSGVHTGQRPPGFRSVLVEQAQQHQIGHRGIDGDIGATRNEMHAKRKRVTRSNDDGHATECKPWGRAAPSPGWVRCRWNIVGAMTSRLSRRYRSARRRP